MYDIVALMLFLSLTLASAGDIFHLPSAENAWWETGVFGFMLIISVGYIIAIVS